MSGLVLLGMWCVVGGAVGAVIGQRSGRLGLGLVLGSLCGVFGWVMLAGAEPRQPVATPVPHPAEAEPSTDAVVPSFLTPVSWTVGQDDQALAASLGQS